MSFSESPMSAIAAAYEADRRTTLLRRLRVATALALLPILTAAVLNWLIFEDRLGERLLTMVVQALICVVVCAVTFVPGVARRAQELTVGMILAIITSMFWSLSLSPQDLDVLAAVVASVIAAPPVIFPWGAAAQALVSVYTVLGYLSLPAWPDLEVGRLINVTIGLVVSAVLSTIGAFTLDRHRRAAFVERERVISLAQQREDLLRVGRVLNGTLHLDELVEQVALLARNLVGATVVTLSFVDREQQVVRPVAIAADARPGRNSRLLLELPFGHLAEVGAELVAGRSVMLPGGRRFAAFAEMEHYHGVRRSLHVPMRHDGTLLGFLSLLRVEDMPYDEAQRLLAEGVADVAAIALANAQMFDHVARTNRLKSEFVSTMSHELRTPLNVILGSAEMASDEALDRAERDACLGRVMSAGRDLLDLVDGTLEIGRIEAGRDAVALERVALPTLWNDLRGVCTRLPRRHEVALEWQDDVPDLEVAIDPRKFSIVLRNLVGNALKFTEHGAVTVTLTHDADRLRVAVADTGIGIRPEDQRAIFEMFRQADGSDTRRFGGTGLGLYIVRRFVEQLGGEVAVASALGAGATFTVTLPIASAQRSAA